MKSRRHKIYIITFFLFMICTWQAKSQTDSTINSVDRILFNKNGLWGYKNNSNDTIIPAAYTMAFDFNQHGIAAVVDSNAWYYINRTGKIVIRPFVYENGPDYFQQGLARFVYRDKIGFFNEKGQIMIDAKFKYATSFHEGLAAFCNDCAVLFVEQEYSVIGGKWGYINSEGNIEIEPIFDAARFFENGQAEVKKNGQWLKINKKGQTIE